MSYNVIALLNARKAMLSDNADFTAMVEANEKLELAAIGSLGIA